MVMDCPLNGSDVGWPEAASEISESASTERKNGRGQWFRTSAFHELAAGRSSSPPWERLGAGWPVPLLSLITAGPTGPGNWGKLRAWQRLPAVRAGRASDRLP